MSSFEWMELETVNAEIAHSQSRLATARSTKDHGLVKLLQREIDEAEDRRNHLLSQLTAAVNASGRAAGHNHAPAGRDRAKNVDKKEPTPEQQPVMKAADGPPSDLATSASTIEGVAAVWDRLTTADIERVKRGLTMRRSEILARHADELRALDAQQAEIDTIEQAIAAFTQKFKVAEAEFVPFDART